MTDGDLEQVIGRVDSVVEVLDVAVSVLRDYGADPGDTRIERMARWIIYNLGVQVHDVRSAGLSYVYTADGELAAAQFQDAIRLSGRVVTGEHITQQIDAEKARQLATALLICAERASE